MRRGFFRVLAVALLALTLPLQGAASVLSAQCMALDHHEAGDHDAEHDHDADGHDHAADGHDHAAPAQSDDASAHCGPCTACCASTSIAGTPAHAIAASPPSLKHAFSQLTPPGVEPHRFDRPPLAL